MKTSKSLFDLTGRTAIVTGGGTHIGKAIAEALIDFGADVHIAGRRFEVCASAAKAFEATGRHCTPHWCDAADESSVESLVGEVIKHSGRLDIMICNAGAASPGDQAPYITSYRWEETVRASATTAFISSQVAARMMVKRNQGSIILLGSIFGSLGANPDLYGPLWPRACSDYNAAKGAVIALTRSLACELGSHGIRVNCISPGQIPHPGSDRLTVENFRLASPLQRTGMPGDVQGAAVLLASDASSFITGHNLTVDGGWSAW